MASKNSRSNQSSARSARASRSARTTPRSQSDSFSRDSANYSGYQSAYTPGSQGSEANRAYGRQTAAGQYSRGSSTYAANSRKSGRGKKIALGVIAAVLVLVVGGGTAAALSINSLNEQLNKGTKTNEEVSAINDVLTTTVGTTFTEPFYMMLIGSDRLDDDPDGGARSDTNIVVRVDPATNTATMVSIPRDTKIDIDGYGTSKFNSAYSYDGAAGAIREASQLLNVKISHYAEVNFDELKGLVDAVGGIDVEVDEMVDDPDADGTSAHPEWPRVIIEPGEQHLNGNQALVFARSRAYADGDFTRTANQRKVIMAVVNKVLALPVTELPGVIQSAATCITTDLSVNDIMGLAQQFKDEGDLTIYSEMVPSTTAEINEGGVMVSYVINDAETTKKMMKVVESGGNPEGITASSAAYAQSEAATNGSGSASGSGYVANSGAYGSSGTSDNSNYYDNSGSGSSGATTGGTGATDYYGTPDGSQGTGSAGTTDGTGSTGGGSTDGYVDTSGSGTTVDNAGSSGYSEVSGANAA